MEADVPTERFQFTGVGGHQLAASLDVPEREPLEIISSPIDLVMEEHQDKGEDAAEQDQPDAPPVDQA